MSDTGLIPRLPLASVFLIPDSQDLIRAKRDNNVKVLSISLFWYYLFQYRVITLPTKVHLVQAVFPVVMYGCESWTVKKAEH